NYSYQNILFQFSIFNIISLHVLLLSSSPRTLHPYSSSFNHLTNLFLSITSSIYLSSNSISFSLSPIRVIKFTSNAFPIQKYLIRSFIPSVQLSGKLFNLSHSNGVRYLFPLPSSTICVVRLTLPSLVNIVLLVKCISSFSDFLTSFFLYFHPSSFSRSISFILLTYLYFCSSSTFR